jgi:tRNA modification GTPase
MKFLYSDEPIIACSTGNQSHAAISVLRISGFSHINSFNPFFKLNLAIIKPRMVYYTSLVSDSQHIDDVCLTYFEAPRSYNGENILELSIHGNTLNVERILSLFLNNANCRLAEPGEFTYRALKNKKLVLSQVEGLDLFLNANSQYALDQGLSLLSGDLQQTYQELFELFLNHKAALELSIDFLEDIGEEAAEMQFRDTLNLFSKKFHSLERRVQPLNHNLVQPEIVLAGLPNSGKSSLFNFLLARDRAIVSPIAGTTRDYLTESLSIEGVNYRLIDTAGIRHTEDLVESEGVTRTKKIMAESFFSVLLINPFEIVDEFVELLDHPFDLVYFTHADCAGFDEAKRSLVGHFPQLGPMGAISVIGLDRVWEDGFFNKVNKKYLMVTSSKPILLDRHKHLITQASIALRAYVKTSAYEKDIAILSSELNTLGHCFSDLIGIISPNEILNSIFSNFCIGK